MHGEEASRPNTREEHPHGKDLRAGQLPPWRNRGTGGRQQGGGGCGQLGVAGEASPSSPGCGVRAPCVRYPTLTSSSTVNTKYSLGGKEQIKKP